VVECGGLENRCGATHRGFESLSLCKTPFPALEAGFLILTTIAATLVKGKMADKPYKLAVLRDRGKDLSKKWYVEYYVYSDKEDTLVRRTIQVPNSCKTIAAKKKFADATIKQINSLLVKGYYLKELVPEPKSKDESLLVALNNVLTSIRPTLRLNGYRAYKSALNKLERYLPNDVEIPAIEKSFPYVFRDYLLNELQNSPRTANNTLDSLSVLFNRLIERSDYETNPFTIKSLKVSATSKNIAFDKEHQKAVELALLDSPRLYLFTRFVYFAFIRPGELIQLQGKHINLTDRYITIPGDVSKNGKTETVPIIPPLYDLLRTEIFEPEKLIFGYNLKPSFQGTGKQVAFRRHEKLLQRIGLGEHPYTLYSWKHTGAVNAYLSGVGVKQLQALLRHSSLAITDNYLKSLGLRTDPNLNDYNW